MHVERQVVSAPHETTVDVAMPRSDPHCVGRRRFQRSGDRLGAGLRIETDQREPGIEPVDLPQARREEALDQHASPRSSAVAQPVLVHEAEQLLLHVRVQLRVLQLDVVAHARPVPPEDLVERWNPKAGISLAGLLRERHVEPGTDVTRPELVQRVVGDPPRTTPGGPIESGVVQHHQDAVAGHVDIELEVIGPLGQGEIVRSEGVFRGKTRRSAMSDVQHARDARDPLGTRRVAKVNAPYASRERSHVR